MNITFLFAIIYLSLGPFNYVPASTAFDLHKADLINSEFLSEERNNSYGKVTSIKVDYCEGLDAVNIKRPGLLNLYLLKKTDSPVQVMLKLVSIIDDPNSTKKNEKTSISLFKLNEGFEEKVLSLKINKHTYHRYDFSCHFGPSVSNYDIDYVYSFPFDTKNTKIKLSQGYGGLSHQESSYYAVDWAMPVGTMVLAARSGKVIALQDKITLPGEIHNDWMSEANYILILHNDNSVGHYLHLSANSIQVNVGDFVKLGQELAKSGNSGYSSGPHLHFEVKIPRSSAFFDLPAGAKDWHASFGLPLKFKMRDGQEWGVEQIQENLLPYESKR